MILLRDNGRSNINRDFLLFTAIITVFVSAVSCNKTENTEFNSDPYVYMKSFWIDHKAKLETTAKEMQDKDIEYFYNGIPMKVEKGHNQKVKNVSYSEAMRSVVKLCKSSYFNDLFGWSKGKEPFFDSGEGYFYVASKDFIDGYGGNVRIYLAYNDSTVRNIDPYTQYEDLGDGWLLITEHIGE